MKAIKYKLLPKQISENDVKRQVKDYLNLKGWFNFHLLAGMGAFKGCPDRIAIKGGRTLFLEIKKPIGGIHRDNQKLFQENVERAGEEYYLIRNLEELIKILNNGKII